jgi:hypothetical protein
MSSGWSVRIKAALSGTVRSRQARPRTAHRGRATAVPHPRYDVGKTAKWELALIARREFAMMCPRYEGGPLILGFPS